MLSPWTYGKEDPLEVYGPPGNTDLVTNYTDRSEFEQWQLRLGLAQFLQKKYAETEHPTVHGWVYDVANGLLRDLNVPFKGILAEIQKIYDLQAE